MRARAALRNLATDPTPALDCLRQIVDSDPKDLALVVDEETIQPLLAFLDAADLLRRPPLWPENAETVRSLLLKVTDGHSKAATELVVISIVNAMLLHDRG